jgi:hypothetical protein
MAIIWPEGAVEESMPKVEIVRGMVTKKWLEEFFRVGYRNVTAIYDK